MRNRSWITWAAAPILLALVAVGCGNSGSDSPTAESTSTTAGGTKAVSITGVPGVTDDEIRFAAIGTKSNNPLGTCVLDCYVNGIQAYFAYRNSEGGVNGRKLVLAKTLDDELSKNQVRAKELVSANDVFGDFNATLLANGFADLDKAGIPTYAWGINFTESEGRQTIFGTVGNNCGTCTGRSVPYVAKLLKLKKVAALGYGISQNSKLCAQATAKSLELYKGDTGATAAYLNDDLAYGLPNGIGPEVSAMKKAGVQLISTCIDLNGMKTLAQELQRQGMDDVVLYHPNTYNQSFVKEAGALFEGDIVGVSFRPFEADASGSALATYLTWMKKTGKDLTELAMDGWINADLAYQGLKAAGPNFDRTKVLAATNAMTAYSADGLINPIDWTRQHNAPTEADRTSHGYAKECVALVKVVKGVFQTVAPKDEPWLCWPNGNDRKWSEPVPTNFK